jgi:hypothetical protein
MRSVDSNIEERVHELPEFFGYPKGGSTQALFHNDKGLAAMTDSVSNSRTAQSAAAGTPRGSTDSMRTDSAQAKDSHPTQMVAQWIVSAGKALATALFKLLRWAATWIYRGVRRVLRHIYDWFMRLNGTAKILFVLNIVLVITVLVLWLDLDLWSVFYGNQ